MGRRFLFAAIREPQAATRVDARAPLVVLGRLDILVADVYGLDEEGVAHSADDLERGLALP